MCYDMNTFERGMSRDQSLKNRFERTFEIGRQLCPIGTPDQKEGV